MTEMDDKLIALWNNGLSAAQVGEALGVSKNAIMGKINRLRAKGITLRARPASEATKEKRQARDARRHRSVALSPKLPRVHAPPVPPTPPAPPTAPSDTQFISLLDLLPWSCRYVVSPTPVGALYCGAPKTKGSYCTAHAAICYVKEKPCNSRTRSRPSNYMRTVRYGITTRGLSSRS